MTKTLNILLALGATTPALAQSNPALPAHDAQGREVVVTASRSGGETTLASLPASVTLLSADDLAERQTRVVSDILRDVPGLAISRTGGVGGLTNVRIRGSESNHVLVLIDGIEVADPFQGEFDFGTLLADEGARVEVLRGQQSSLYGSDAIGGVIQYLTPTGRDLPGVSARAEGGSFGTAAGAARIGAASGALDGALSATVYRTDGSPTARGGTRDVGDTSVGASAKASWTPSPAFKLTGVGRYSLTDALTNDSSVARANYGQTIDSPGAHFRNQAYYGLARAELSLAGGRWLSAVSGQYGDTTRRNYERDAVSFGENGRRTKATGETSYRFGDRVTQRLTAAVDWERESFRNLTPSPFAFGGRRATTDTGLVGQYELTVGDAFAAGASVRHDFNTRFADATTWRAQAGYRLPFGLRARGAYGTGIKNPGYYELYGYSDGRYIGNPNLRPEKSEGWEAGADYAIGETASLGATYFQSRLRDEIYTTYPAPTFVATPGNRATFSRQHGIETFVSARPIPELKFDLAYTWLHATENGVEEVRRPPHIASINATVFSPDQRFSTTLTVRYNGRQTDVTFTDPTFATTPTVHLQEYALVNLAADYKLSSRLSLFGRVDNLFDERYEEVFSFVGTGAAAYGGVRARF